MHLICSSWRTQSLGLWQWAPNVVRNRLHEIECCLQRVENKCTCSVHACMHPWLEMHLLCACMHASMAGKPAFVRARLAPSAQAESLAWKSGGMRHVWEWGKAPWASYIQLISCFGQTCFPYVKFTCVSLHIYVKFTCVNLHIWGNLPQPREL